MFLLDQSISVYKSSLLQTPHGFGTKQTGDGRDIDVIKTVLNKEDIDYASIVIPSQTHSTNVAVIADAVQEDVVTLSNTDAVVTNQKDIVLTVVTADCIPILYYDPHAGIIGISHGGWKGTLGTIDQNVIGRMIAMGSERKNIIAAIGPGIDSCCYDVYGDRLSAFQTSFGDTVLTKEESYYHLDLKEANRRTLMKAGLLPTHIDISKSCTSCKRSEFYSYKRDHSIKGEMVSFIVLLQ